MSKISSPNQSLTNGDLLTSPAGNLNQSNLKNATTNTRPLKLRRVNHTDEIVFGFSSLLRNESMTDVTLICNGGQTIRAHRVILSTFSPYFRAIFESQPFSNNPCQYPVIVIKDLELSELKTIIDFIYKGEVSVSRDKLQSVLQAAKALEVSGLADLKLESFGVNNNNSNSNGNINTLLANSLMNSPNTLSNNNSNISSQNNNDLDQLNFGSLSALNYVCNLNNKRVNNNLNSSLDSADLFNENQLKKLRVSIDDSSELLNSLGTSLLGDNTVNIDGVRSLLQQPPRLPIQQLKQQAQLNQFQQQINKQRQMQMIQQRQQLQRLQQQQQNQQRLEQIRQLQQLKNKQLYSIPKNNALQGQQLAQFQEKIKKQIQEKQAQQKAPENNNNSSNGNKSSNDDKANKNQDQDEPEIIEHLEVNCENGEEMNGDDKLNGEQNDLIVDDENNNEINKLDDEEGKKDGDDNKNGEDLENGDNSFVDYDENADTQQMNADEEEYEIDINKDLVFQRQQQIRLEQLQKQAHFQNQFNLMQVDDPENRNLENLQQQLLQAAGLRNGTNDLNELNNSTSRRNSSKDSLIQTSSASGSEDTDNDNNNDNTLDINDNLSIMDNNFFDDYNNLASRSPIPMQVKLDPQLNRIPQTPDFLLPRGPGRPRKGNKGSDISPCPECHKKFVRPDVLKLHYRSVHLLERHPCNMCPKVFKWPGDLSKHKRKSCRGNLELANNRT